MTRDEALALGRKQGASAGGQAVKDKTPPATCLRCGQPMTGRSGTAIWDIWSCTAWPTAILAAT